jgi:hypothetical protein
MLDLIENKKKYQEIDKRNQKIFWDLYRKNLSLYENNKNHGKELRGRIGMEFLKQNNNYLT